MWIFSNLVFFSYTALDILHCLFNNRGNARQYYVIITYASLGIFYLLLLVCVIVLSHLEVEEARESSIYIHKLILRPGIRIGVVKELMKFAAQLKVMQVKFTACGFFTMDLPFLFTVIWRCMHLRYNCDAA